MSESLDKMFSFLFIYPPGPQSEGLIFKIFQTPEAEVIILSLHFNSQNKKTNVFVFLIF